MDLVEIATTRFNRLSDGERGLLHAAESGELFWCGKDDFWDQSNDPGKRRYLGFRSNCQSNPHPMAAEIPWPLNTSILMVYV